MGEQSGITLEIWFALFNAGAMIFAAIFVVFFHDRRYADIEQWIDYSFSHQVLKRVILYYRGLAALMAIFFVLFVISMIILQRGAGIMLFAEGKASIAGMTLFALDLLARGALFDWMEHFELRFTPLHMNREMTWFVIYAFVFRMFYGLTLLKILISFAWIYGKIRVAKREAMRREGTLGEGNLPTVP